jgi:outer membrane usher protein
MNFLIKLFLFCITLLPFIYLWADVEKEKAKGIDLHDYYQQAFGKKQTLPSQLNVTLQLSNREVAKLKIYSEDHKKITHIETTPFLGVLHKTLKPKYLQPLLKRLDNQTRISLADLKKTGITTQFDQASLSLKLDIPIKMRLPITLRLGRKRKKKHYPATNELAQAATVSAYTNFDAKIDYDDSSSQHKQRLHTSSALNIKGVVLENRMTWRNDRQQQWSRDSTRVVVDDPSSLRRYTLGDTTTEYRNYQQGIPLAGLRIEKKSGLNPYLKTEPSSEHVFSLTRSSTVNIYINGFLKDKKKLAAGEYKLTDLNLVSGVNKIRLQITDKNGTTREQSFSLLKDQSLLASGRSSYAVEVGVPAYRLKDKHHYDTATLLVSGHYKAGLSDHLTADTSFISDGESLQIGINALTATPIGNINGRISQLKTAANKQGYAAGFKYQYSPPIQKKDAVQFSVSGDYFDKQFTALSYSLENKRLHSTDNQSIKSRVSANIGKKLGKNLGTHFNIQRETSYQKPTIRYSANVGLSQSFKKGGSVSAQLRYQNNQQNDKSVNLRLNIPMAKQNKKTRHKTLTTSYNSMDKQLINSFFISPKSNTGKGSLGGSVSTYSRKKNHTLNANISYRGDIAEIGFSQRITKTKNRQKKYKVRSNARVKTALSFADGQFAISKPISDSFVIVTGPDHQDKDIAVIKGNGGFSHTEGKQRPDYYQGIIQKDLSPAVISVPSYYYNTVNVDSTSLPLGSDINRTEFAVKPSYKQGYVLKAGGESGVIVDATLLDASGTPLALKGGQLVALDVQRKPLTFFTNRTGRIRLISVPPGKYQLDLFDNKKETKQILNIPNKIGKIHNIGKIKIDH